VRVLYVPAEGFTAHTRDEIAAAIRERLGSIEVILEQVSQIPREKNGKFRAVISRLPLVYRNGTATIEKGSVESEAHVSSGSN